MRTEAELDHRGANSVAVIIAANAAKPTRSRAALKRQIDKLANNADMSGEPDILAQMDLGRQAYELTEYVYPELSDSIFLIPNSKGDQPTFAEFAKVISTIYSLGELPTWRELGSDTYVSADELDTKASQTEEAAKALYLSPPSEDFMKEHQLGKLGDPTTPEGEAELYKAAERVAELLSEADELDRKLAKIRQKLNETMKTYSTFDSEVNPGSGTEMARVLVEMIDDVTRHMPNDEARNEFESHIAGMSSESTALWQLRRLYCDGMRLAGNQTKAAAAQKRAIYDAVISGEVAEYVSPEAEPTNPFGPVLE